MSTINPGIGRLLSGAGGVLLIVSLFLPWSDGPGAGSVTGWGVSAPSDVMLAIAGSCGIAAAITGGRFGFFRPDVSMNGAADLLGVLAAVLIGWLIAFDLPSGASAQAGAYLGLIAGISIACGAGDFRVTSLFPRMPDRSKPR